MKVFDFVININKKNKILGFSWNNKELELHFSNDWCQFIGKAVSSIIDIDTTIHAGNVCIGNKEFKYGMIFADSVISIVFRESMQMERIFSQILEHVDTGVHLYDENGYLLYCNSKALEISAIPQGTQVFGKHLNDIYQIDDGYSTALTCLKDKTPIIDRVDSFHSLTHGNIISVNTAHPIFFEDELKGTLVFDMDLELVKKKYAKLEETKKAMQEYLHEVPKGKEQGFNFSHIIGNSTLMDSAVSLAKRFADVDCNILIIGETGTGKEMFAQSIHRASLRNTAPFVALNCAAVPETLIESMLFGTMKGAFTGSDNRTGLFEEANNGTLFLDEINSMSPMMQSKILRVVQEGVFRRIGGSKDLNTDIRIISSTNEDPMELMNDSRMRKDLFYRLSSVQIHIPPLRERLEDLPLLVESYLSSKMRRFAKTVDYISPEVMEIFSNYNWPGNVRELFHVLDYATNIHESGAIDSTCLPAYLIADKNAVPAKSSHSSFMDYPIDSTMEEMVAEFETAQIKKVLEHHGYNISRSAKSLGLCRQSLSYKIKKYGIIF